MSLQRHLVHESPFTRNLTLWGQHQVLVQFEKVVSAKVYSLRCIGSYEAPLVLLSHSVL
jgi:hypothetical protein